MLVLSDGTGDTGEKMVRAALQQFKGHLVHVRTYAHITRPEQLITALARAMQVLTNPADCGPVTLSLCQDVQAEAFDYPAAMFEERVWTPRRPQPDANELEAAVAAIRTSQKPVIRI